MKGTGQMQISYSGAEHYAGSYSFKGNMNGQPMDTIVLLQGRLGQGGLRRGEALRAMQGAAK